MKFSTLTTVMPLVVIIGIIESVTAGTCLGIADQIHFGNICGPTSMGLADPVPDAVDIGYTWWGSCGCTFLGFPVDCDCTRYNRFHVGDACHAHDYCYDAIRNNPYNCDEQFTECNNNFHADMTAMCDELPDQCQRDICYGYRDTYYAVVIGTKDHYFDTYGCTNNGPPVTAECDRPHGWCTHQGAVYEHVDCDGDGILDHVCYDHYGSRGVRLSGSGCQPTWPNAAADTCEPVFGRCERQSGWCTHGGSTYRYFDCKGGGIPQHVCYDSYGSKGVVKSSTCDDNWPNAEVSDCIDIFWDNCFGHC